MKKSVKEFVRTMLMRIVPGWYRTRLFARIDHPTREAIAKHRIEPEMLLLPALLARIPDGVFLDVGANIGEYLHIASRTLQQASLFAFEPQSQYVRQLRMLFRNAHIEQLALSSEKGSASFKVPHIQGTPYPTRGTLESFIDRGEDGAAYQRVSLEKLDTYSIEKGIKKISVIKIDVEGHERAVIEGGQQTIRALKPTLIVEIEQRHHTESITKVLSFIESLGYTGWFYDVPQNSLMPRAEFSVETHQALDTFKSDRYVNNFIFIPEGVEVTGVALPKLP